MTTPLPGVPAPTVEIHHGQAVTTSLAVAEYFGRNHRNVLRAIKNLLSEIPEEFGRPNFAQSSYLNEQGKEQPAYELTKNGFTLLAMGFTGPQALQFKLRYIEAFDRLEAAALDRAVAAGAGKRYDFPEAMARSVLGDPRKRSMEQSLYQAFRPKPAPEEPDFLCPLWRLLDELSRDGSDVAGCWTVYRHMKRVAFRIDEVAKIVEQGIGELRTIQREERS